MRQSLRKTETIFSSKKSMIEAAEANGKPAPGASIIGFASENTVGILLLWFLRQRFAVIR